MDGEDIEHGITDISDWAEDAVVLFYRPSDSLKSIDAQIAGLRWRDNCCYINAMVHALCYAWRVWHNDDESGHISDIKKTTTTKADQKTMNQAIL